jgi:flagellar biosynthesis protein
MNKSKREAIALSYQSDKSAPEVVAKGKGYIAENILKAAKDHQIPVQEDASLVELHSELNINEQIPEELYHVVAEVFAFIYKVDQEQKKS